MGEVRVGDALRVAAAPPDATLGLGAVRRLLLVGAPGSGKGTVGPDLAAWLQVPHVSSGELLRASLRDGDPYGVAGLVVRGELVPDEVIAAVVAEHLGSGFVLEGYPRTGAQARRLDGALRRAGRAIQVVLELAIPDEVVVARLARRALIEHRTDDDPVTVAARLAIHHREVGQLLGHYRSRVVAVDGVGTIAEVCERARAAVLASAAARLARRRALRDGGPYPGARAELR